MLLTPVTARVDGEDRAGFIAPDGRLVHALDWDDATPFSEGLSAVKRRGRWGYIDRMGMLVIPFGFYWAGPFRNGHALVELRGIDLAEGIIASALIDTRGRVLIEGEGRYRIENLGEGLLNVPRLGLVDLSSRVVLSEGTLAEMGLESIHPFSERLACIRLRGKWGFMDTRGAVTIPATFAGAHSFAAGYAPVQAQLNGPWSFVDRNGLPGFGTYVSARSFREGLAAVEVESGRWGFVDTKGAVAIPARFKEVEDFSEGLAAAWPTGDGAGGYIDRQGNFVFRTWLKPWTGFEGGVVAVSVWKDLRWERAFLDRTGVLLWPPIR